MSYPASFLEIQVRFARRLGELSGQSLCDTILHHTALYRILGLNGSLDPHHPVWQRFLAELRDDGGGAGAAYIVYLERHEQGLIPDHDMSRPHWGCFSYEHHPDEQTVHMHFSNWDTTGKGPLSSQRRTTRLMELRAMFRQIRQTHPEVSLVQGGSWLYNREAYLRLFPPSYRESARVDQPHVTARSLWGQFLRHGSRLNEDAVAQFTGRLEALRDAAKYAACFPYQVLLTEAPVVDFYAFYDVHETP